MDTVIPSNGTTSLSASDIAKVKVFFTDLSNIRKPKYIAFVTSATSDRQYWHFAYMCFGREISHNYFNNYTNMPYFGVYGVCALGNASSFRIFCLQNYQNNWIVYFKKFND